MAFAKLPDSKRDSNTKSSSDMIFRCAFTKYFELPTHDRLNCVTSKQFVNDLVDGLLAFDCALLASGSCCSGDSIASGADGASAKFLISMCVVAINGETFFVQFVALTLLVMIAREQFVWTD